MSLESLENTARKILNVYEKPFNFGNQEFRTGVNIGIAMFPIHGESGEELIRNSEATSKEAKNLGKNNFKIYTSLMANQITSRVNIENALFGALERKELFLHYQPRIESKTGRIIGTEALLRWKKSNPRISSPCEFYSICRRIGADCFNWKMGFVDKIQQVNLLPD